MIEWLGLAYTLAKEALGYYKDAKEAMGAAKDIAHASKEVKERLTHQAESAPGPMPEPAALKEIEPKGVDREWGHKSGFFEHAKALGYDLRWSRRAAVASREFEGYEVLYEIDLNAGTKRKLLHGGLVLIGKKVTR